MTVEFAPTSMVPGNRLDSVLYCKERIAEIARLLVVNQVEALIEMASDFPEEVNTFAEAKRAIAMRAQECTHDYAADLLEEFRDALHEAIDEVKIELISAQFSAKGMEDAMVKVC